MTGWQVGLQSKFKGNRGREVRTCLTGFCLFIYFFFLVGVCVFETGFLCVAWELVLEIAV